jgi:hypothetical protein
LQPNLKNDFVAQLVEQKTLNLWVVSSSLTGVTLEKGRNIFRPFHFHAPYKFICANREIM